MIYIGLVWDVVFIKFLDVGKLSSLWAASFSRQEVLPELYEWGDNADQNK